VLAFRQKQIPQAFAFGLFFEFFDQGNDFPAIALIELPKIVRFIGIDVIIQWLSKKRSGPEISGIIKGQFAPDVKRIMFIH
jgi:hypothetical protein